MQPSWVRHLPPGVAPESVDLMARRSLPAVWAKQWADDPDAPAVHDDGWMSNGELDRRSRQVAGRFAGAGLRAGDRIVMSAATSADLVVAHVAALRLGLVVVPVNGAYRAREVGHIVADCAPAACVVDGDRAEMFAAAAGDGALLMTTPRVELPDAEAPPLDEAEPTDVALLCYTSGTTGTPKGAMLSHGNALASCEAVRFAWRWTAADRLVLALPLFHVHGLGVGLHGTLLCGASAVLLPRFEPEAVLDAARAHEATLFFGVPTMYSRLASSPRVAELEALRLCVSGSAPLPASLHDDLAVRAGVRVLERYGMTETIMNISNPYDGERRAGTVGFPLPGVEVRLAESSGEIQLRGPNVFPGYWGRPEATREAFTEDGWFRSGDIGMYDADGYLCIVGRAKELIISGGYNVYPREVEDVLLAHPDVAEVAVVGEPSDEWGELVVAVVVPTGDAPDADELLAFAAAQLAPYKQPRRVRFAETLPRNALGKVVRAEL